MMIAGAILLAMALYLIDKHNLWHSFWKIFRALLKLMFWVGIIAGVGLYFRKDIWEYRGPIVATLIVVGSFLLMIFLAWFVERVRLLTIA